MSSAPAPFIPAKLDDADLTPHEFRVFCHVSRRGDCTASVGKMSSDTGVSEPTLRDALKTLREASMIEKQPRPGTTNIHRVLPTEEWDLSALNDDENEPDTEGDPSQDFGDPKKLPLQKVRDHPSQLFGDHPSQDFGGASKGYPLEGNPLEGAIRGVAESDDPLPAYLLEVVDRISWQAEPLPDDHPARWEYHRDDWRWIAAEWALSRLEGDEMLNSYYRKRLKDERRGKIASEWADEIRKLVELDGYSRDDVRITLGWLLGTDNWWRRNRTIQSLKALRKKGDDGTTKFDKILQSALADYEQKQQQQADPEAIRAGFETDDERGPEAAGPAGDSLPREPEVGPGDFVW